MSLEKGPVPPHRPFLRARTQLDRILAVVAGIPTAGHLDACQLRRLFTKAIRFAKVVRLSGQSCSQVVRTNVG